MDASPDTPDDVDGPGARPEDGPALWRALSATHQRLERELTARLRGSGAGVSESEFEVLDHLVRAGGELRSRDLASALGWEKSRLSHLLTRMQSRRLVERGVGLVDRPGTWIALTESGRAAHAAAEPVHAAVLHELLLGRLSPAERTAMLQLFRRHLDEAGPDGASAVDG